jgi:hypothetical protein
MQTIQNRTHLILREIPDGEELRDGDWFICFDPSSGIPSGRIKIQLSSSQQVQCLQQMADKQVISIGGDSLPVEVSNFQTMPLPKLQGNGSGVP